MTIDLATLAGCIAALPAGRRVVALAGPPAAGKSTTAEALARSVTELGRPAQVVPMDGFHLDNAALDALGLRARKGAPETFDAAGLIRLVAALRAGGAVAYPTFDRAADATVPDGGQFAADIALVEGNYLLLDEDPWRDLHPMWDLSVMIDVSEATLRDRLIDRWTGHGFAPDAALAKAEGNDLPNARRVLRDSITPDLRLSTAGETP
ncbi:phosphoribulokinase [Jannaschia pohangensis]|uniref:Phosphoribulokinase / Uridine kinase family protein n=1 Tax=Jannaschia pohangensis TaxID=390807 RepID=A0A1I3IIK4_9RHOB|nr:phosphoribulokinase [Jannaschia pohangensis]SFI47709.1 Phosphoribulokinase / Uridine kinase family protein [Jannaschia pohangensis]